MSAKKFITDNGAEVHDRVRIETGDLTYEGLILPKHNFSEDNIIIIKLDNGYNIGISTENAKMTLISKAEKKDTVTHAKKENKELPDISILGTGGTIASFVDYKTGAVSPAITAEQLVNSVKALDVVANVSAEPLFSLASEDMKPEHWEGMANKVKEMHDKNNHGIVIGHGTDTMSYSAAALSFQLPEISNPVVFTGAQRSPDRPSSDAQLNLVGAAKVAITKPMAAALPIAKLIGYPKYLKIGTFIMAPVIPIGAEINPEKKPNIILEKKLKFLFFFISKFTNSKYAPKK